MNEDPATTGEAPSPSDSPLPSLIAAVLVLTSLAYLAGRDQSEPAAPGRVPAAAAPDLAEFRPPADPRDGFIGSDNCRECHADQHESWHASYHRTMTQPARPETVMGDFDNVTLSFPGTNGAKRFQLHRNGGRLWAEFDTVGDLSFGDERVTLRWTASDDPDVASYEVFLSDLPFDESSLPEFETEVDGVPVFWPRSVAAGEPSTAQSTRIEGLTNGTTYYAALRAIDEGGQIGPLSAVFSARPQSTCGAAECAGEPEGCHTCGSSVLPRRQVGLLGLLLGLSLGARRRR